MITGRMVGVDAYLDGLLNEQAEVLRAVNGSGLAAMRKYLRQREAVAFLGAGASAPLYPLWGAAISDLVDVAVERGLGAKEEETCRVLARAQPDAVVEVLRRHLGRAQYQAALRQTFRVRRDPETGRTWTPTHELVCRCAFRAVVTTNYDPGIVDARMRTRPEAMGTGFTSWTNELALDRWRTEDAFGDNELPVLFAHGQHNHPESIVLATTEYRQAYAGKLSRVLAQLVDKGHLVWIGFSFTDQQVAAVLREVAERAGTRIEPGGAVRHVAVMAWDPEGGQDPATLRTLAEIQYGADLVLYPAPHGDHGALQRLLAEFVDARFPPVPSLAPAVEPLAEQLPTLWAHGVEEGRLFRGRTEELARLSRWAADPSVRLIGVNAWGGAGKTALVTHWLQRGSGASRRVGARGVFAWSFYADPSAEQWARSLVAWAGGVLDIHPFCEGLAASVIEVVQSAPMVLVLDGLEAIQVRSGKRRLRPTARRCTSRSAHRTLSHGTRLTCCAYQSVPVC
jgi:hypothetical protein